MPYTVKGKCVYKKDGGAKVGCTKGSVKAYLAALHANANESVTPIDPTIGTCNGFDYGILAKGTIAETKTPKIFTYTAYRLPNQEDLKEINNANLDAKSIVDGFTYTIVGRGILSNDNKAKILESINMLISAFPENKEYKKALQLASEKTGGHITEMKGGKAHGMTVKDIADKHDVPVSKIEKQISIGKKIEREHTDNPELAKEISMDHLVEFPDYYTRLVKMEKEAERHLKKEKIDETTKDLIKRLIRENLGF